MSVDDKTSIQFTTSKELVDSSIQFTGESIQKAEKNFVHLTKRSKSMK